MKKILINSIVIIIIILLLPFVFTFMFSSNNNSNVIDMEYTIYFEQNGNKTKLEFDQYIAGVVAANMPAGYHIEALKAQAVIARTYALYNINLLSQESPNKTQYTTSELGLAYINTEDMEYYWGNDDYLTYLAKIENAVYGTNNQVLLYNNTLILPVFFETGSGYTRNASEAWGIDLPYLISVPSKQDITSINYLKIAEYDIEDVISKLQQYFSNINISEINFFENVVVTERDSTNYVIKIKLDSSTTISGEMFAKALGLSSNHFYIEEYENKVRIICTGVGHGVGLSQYGANAMAEEGSSYKEILTYYYSGTQLTDLDGKN